MHKPGFVVWFTGLSGSGKTTLAVDLEKELLKRNLRVQRLDGDIVRKSLTKDLGFTEEDRKKNIERITFVTRLLAKHGVATLVSFISPYISVRDNARNEVNEENLKSVVAAAGVEVDETKIKSLIASLKGVDIDKELAGASLVSAAPAGGSAGASEGKPEEK